MWQWFFTFIGALVVVFATEWLITACLSSLVGVSAAVADEGGSSGLEHALTEGDGIVMRLDARSDLTVVLSSCEV